MDDVSNRTHLRLSYMRSATKMLTSATLALACASGACGGAHDSLRAGAPAVSAAIRDAAPSGDAVCVVTVDGRQKMYLPLARVGPDGHGAIAVIDVGVSARGAASAHGAPALVGMIDLGTADVAAVTAGDDHAVVAASADDHVWIVDPRSDALVAPAAAAAIEARSPVVARALHAAPRPGTFAARTVSLADGRPIGFVVSADQHWVARIDLEKLADLRVAAGPGVEPDIAPAVTVLDATAPVASR